MGSKPEEAMFCGEEPADLGNSQPYRAVSQKYQRRLPGKERDGETDNKGSNPPAGNIFGQ